MEIASLRSSAFVGAEDMNTPRSGYRERRAKPMHEASSGSAKREAVVAHHPGKVCSAGSRKFKAAALPLCAVPSACKQESKGPFLPMFRQLSIGQAGNQCRYASSSAGLRLALPSKALPNPSLKLSPNSKTPGPRYSAVHHLQRGPGVSPSVPA
jgi:hypothetical protein